MKPRLWLTIISGVLITGCTITQAEALSFTENQIDHVATSRGLYKEGVPTKDQLIQQMKRDASSKPNSFMDPIVKSSLQGMTQEQNQKAIRAIEETDCKNRVLAWAAVELPEDKAAEYVMIYIVNKESTWTWTCRKAWSLIAKAIQNPYEKSKGRLCRYRIRWSI